MTRYHVPDGLFLGSRAVTDGLLTTRMLSSNLVRRVLHNVYLPAGMTLTYPLKCEAAALIAPPDAVLTGRSAAAVRGLVLPRIDEPVEIVVDERNRFGPVAGMKIRRTKLIPHEHTPWRTMRIASDQRMVLDMLLRHSPRTRPWSRRLRGAVADIDCALHNDLVDERTAQRAVDHRRDQGIVLGRQAVALMDGRAESPPESEVRVVLTLAGLPPEVQVMVCDGTFVARIDLGYPERKLAVEYDGEWHDTTSQVRLDKLRRARLRALGWRFVILHAEDLRGEADVIVSKVRAALAAAA